MPFSPLADAALPENIGGLYLPGGYPELYAAELFANETIGWYQQGSYAVAAGDVTIAPSADGFKVYVYYYDHNSQVVGGYVADCIKR